MSVKTNNICDYQVQVDGTGMAVIKDQQGNVLRERQLEDVEDFIHFVDELHIIMEDDLEPTNIIEW